MFCKVSARLFVCLLVLVALNASAPAAYVLDTGDPNERFCNPHSYADLGNGIVRDNVTGLEWVQDGNLMATRDPSFDNDGTSDGRVTWQHALDYIDLLNADSYLSHSDWRLPTVEELATLLDAGRSSPSIDPVFTGTVASYWSSTGRARDSGKAWCVTFANISRVYNLNKTSYVSVRAVRGDAYGGAGIFVVNGDGTVTDTSTGLIWNQCLYGQTWDDSTCTGVASTRSWPQALQYVQGLNDSSYLGYSDWRLSTRNELQTLVDYSLHNPATAFPSMGSNSCISSTAVPDYKWYVSFWDGSVNYSDQILWGNVRAVRGGACQLEEAECREDDECADGEICSVEVGTCTNCVSDAECAPGELCTPDTGLCVECITGDDCAGGGACSDGQCVLASCERDSDCVAGYDCLGGLCRPASCPYDAACGDGWYCFSSRCIPDWAYCVDELPCGYYEACINWQCVSLDDPPEIVAGPFVAEGPEPWPELSALPASPTLLSGNVSGSVTILWEFDDDFGACEDPCMHSAQYQALGAEGWSGLEVYTDEGEPFVAPHYAWVELPVVALQHGATHAFRFSVIDCMDHRVESEIYYFQPWPPQCDDDSDCPEGEICNVETGSCVECVSDADCDGAWEVCFNGECYQTGVSTCQQQSDCMAGDECLEGVCRADYCTENRECGDGWQCFDRSCMPSWGECADSSWCLPFFEECIDWVCRPSGWCAEDGSCDDGIACNGAETCDNGTCVDGASPCEAGTYCEEGSDSCVECLGDEDCPTFEYCVGNECVECRGSEDCDNDIEFCNGYYGCISGDCVFSAAPCATETCNEVDDVCEECLADRHCPSGYCVSKRCVECRNHADCDDGVYCNGAEVCTAGVCGDGTDPCSGATPYCVEATDSCVACEDDADCSDGVFCNGAEVCTAGVCGDGADPCSGATPYCLEETDSCVECTSSSHCDDGYACESNMCEEDCDLTIVYKQPVAAKLKKDKKVKLKITGGPGFNPNAAVTVGSFTIYKNKTKPIVRYKKDVLVKNELQVTVIVPAGTPAGTIDVHMTPCSGKIQVL